NVFDFDDMNEGEISGRNLSISNCVYDSLTGDFAIVGSDSKTASEIEALMSGWTNVNEDTITFADDSRSFLQYAKDYLDDDGARVDHLLYVMIADAADGIMTPELDIDYVFDYVRAGYEIVSLDAEDYGGIMPGITVGTL